jgi:hypothetical protein
MREWVVEVVMVGETMDYIGVRTVSGQDARERVTCVRKVRARRLAKCGKDINVRSCPFPT